MMSRISMRLGPVFPAVLVFLAAVLAYDLVWADSIWNSVGSQPPSLYSRTQGKYKIGDIITIMIVENFSASNAAETETDKESELDIEFDGFDDYFGVNNIFGRPITVNPQLRLDAQSEFEGGGSSRRSSSVTGTVTGQITEVLPNGNLRIEASQTVVINDEKNNVILVGTIRAQDISAQNSIFSTQIANAEIRYEGRGPLSNVQKRGVIKEIFEFLWPF